MKTYFGYTRVSTTKQGEGASLPAQREAIYAYAQQNNLLITDWYEEQETAAVTGRPAFNSMVKRLQAGEADGLIIHKIDRSARNFRDWAHIGELADSGIDIHFVTETLDFQSRGGRLAADIQAVIAADYIRNLREETRKGVEGRLRQGLYPFKAPIGYLDMGAGNPKVPDPETAPLVAEAFHLYSSGNFSLAALRNELIALGLCGMQGRAMHVTALGRMLSNPFYMGTIEILTTGETYPGVHQPLIDPALFKQVQTVLQSRARKTMSKHDYLYRGIFKCSLCGSAMTAEKQKSWVYYRCHKKGCPTKTVREDHITEYLKTLLQGIWADDVFWKEVGQQLIAWHKKRPATPNLYCSITMQLKTTQARLNKTIDAYVDGKIPEAVFEERSKELHERCSALKLAQNHAREIPTERAQLIKFIKSLSDLEGTLTPLTNSERREFVELFTKNRFLSSNHIEVSLADYHKQLNRLVFLLGRVFSRHARESSSLRS